MAAVGVPDRVEYLSVDGDDVFEDRTDYQRFGPGEPAPVGIPDKLVVRID